MTYQENLMSYKTCFQKKFDAYKKFQKELSLGNDGSDEF